MTDVGEIVSIDPTSGLPRKNPLIYPGTPIVGSALVTPSRVLPMTLQYRRRLQQARVRIDSGGLPGDPRAANSDKPLNYTLMRMNEPSVNSRSAVLAIGASPVAAQLRDRLDHPGRRMAIPLVEAQAEGLDIAMTAGVTRWGYVSNTPIIRPGHICRCHVMWLDQSQIAEVPGPHDGSEFRVLWVPAGDPADGGVQVTLARSGKILGGIYLWASTFGHLIDPDTGEPLQTGPQPELLSSLLRRSERLRATYGTTPKEWVARARIDGSHRHAHAIFADEGMVGSDPLTERAQAQVNPAVEPLVLRRFETILPANPVRPGECRVRKTPEPITRNGESVVIVSDRLARERFRRVGHVMVAPAMPGARHGIEVIAKLVSMDDEALLDHGFVDLDVEVGVDQVIRNAIGIEVGEDVTLQPVHVPRRGWSDVYFGAPNYVIGRVQAADLTSVEAEVCLMDDLTLELLGIESGDQVVLEGRSQRNGAIIPLKIKAYAANPTMVSRRSQLEGGGFDSLFPSSLDALGVFPDLPWVFLDAGTKRKLGLHVTKLAPVRVRASRPNQLGRDFRDLLLVFGLAFIGALQIFTDFVSQVVMLIALVALVTIAMTSRTRARLSRKSDVTEANLGVRDPAGFVLSRRRRRRRWR